MKTKDHREKDGYTVELVDIHSVHDGQEQVVISGVSRKVFFFFFFFLIFTVFFKKFFFFQFTQIYLTSTFFSRQ